MCALDQNSVKMFRVPRSTFVGTRQLIACQPCIHRFACCPPRKKTKLCTTSSVVKWTKFVLQGNFARGSQSTVWSRGQIKKKIRTKLKDNSTMQY